MNFGSPMANLVGKLVRAQGKPHMRGQPQPAPPVAPHGSAVRMLGGARDLPNPSAPYLFRLRPAPSPGRSQLSSPRGGVVEFWLGEENGRALWNS